MKTKDDRVFCVLLADAMGVQKKKIHYMMYMLQASGFKLGYVYTLKKDMIRSHGLLGVIGDQISLGYLNQDYTITGAGLQYLNTFVLTADDSDVVDTVLDYVINLDLEEVFYICLVDILIQDALKTGGSTALVENKEQILNIVNQLCSGYTLEDFNDAIGIMMKLREMNKEDK